MSQELYPLRFKEFLRDYGFGNRWITTAFQKTGLPDNHPISETWEVCDRPGESSEIINGAFEGKTLHDVIDSHGEALLGREIMARTGTRFPLLIKFLDVSNQLGEQVHPDDALALKQGLTDTGKTEAWYFVKTKPGASVEICNRPGMTRKDLEDALLKADPRSALVRRDVKPGDAFLLYAGKMHYGSNGFIFYEIMQNSDSCISLRPDRLGNTDEERREIVAKVMPAIHLEDDCDIRATPVTVKENGVERTITMACDYFALDRLDFEQPTSFECNGDKFYILSLLEGECKVKGGSGEVTLLPGLTCLLPASLGKVTLEPKGKVSILKAYVPDLKRDIVEPLRALGISDERIKALGARTELNHLAKVLEQELSLT